MTIVSKYFTKAETIVSSSAAQRGIANSFVPIKQSGINYLPSMLESNVKETAKSMDLVRELLGKPIKVNSWYRNPAVNKLVGGVRNSDHQTGYAVDFVCPDYGSPIEICEAIAKFGIKFHQLIEEGTWVHISFDPKMSRKIMTMRNGRYSLGLRQITNRTRVAAS